MCLNMSILPMTLDTSAGKNMHYGAILQSNVVAYSQSCSCSITYKRKTKNLKTDLKFLG